MSDIDRAVQGWIDLLNRELSEDEERALLAPDILVVTHPMGREGYADRHEGYQAVMTWVGRTPDVYTFVHLSSKPCDRDPALPEADRALTCHYRLITTESDWTNEGDWTLHVKDGQLSAVHHEPDPIED